jgi:hypothetical protein
MIDHGCGGHGLEPQTPREADDLRKQFIAALHLQHRREATLEH